MTVNAVQIGGNHYKNSENQPWDLISRHGISFLEGNVIKYVTRWRTKNGVQDLEKAHHYLLKIEESHEFGYEPVRGAGPHVIKGYFEDNGIDDFREMIVISIMASLWTSSQLNYALLLLNSLLETARNGEAQES